MVISVRGLGTILVKIDLKELQAKELEVQRKKPDLSRLIESEARGCHVSGSASITA